MKSIHFCTPEKLKEIKIRTIFSTVRTGFIPQYYDGDIIKVQEVLEDKSLKFLFNAKVISVEPIRYEKIPKIANREELERYHRKFHNNQYFFRIFLCKQLDVGFNLEELDYA